MKKFLTIVLLTCISSSYSQSLNQTQKAAQVQLNTITTAVPFLTITPDSRSGAMGDVGVALSPDANSFHWNTSKLVFSKENSQFCASYSPWLRGQVDDIQFTYFSGYAKIGENHAAGGSIRYFSLGNVVFTNVLGNIIREFNPNEFEFLGGYAYKLSDRSAVGLNGKFIYSNLTGGSNDGSEAELAGALDLSYSWFNQDLQIGKTDAILSFGATISNIGNKIAYFIDSLRDFLPANIKIGSALGVKLNSNHKIVTSLDFNKLMVPNSFAAPNNTTALQGVFRSFVDTQGFSEAIREITVGIGLEYSFKDFIKIRTGYFNEHASKGNRKFVTFGAGLQFKSIGIDGSYILSAAHNNALANTLRISISYRLKS